MPVDGGEIPPMRAYPSRGLPAAELFINDVPRRCAWKDRNFSKFSPKL